MSDRRRDILLALALAALLALVPAVFGTRYIISQITLFFIWGIVVTQWNLVLGVAGIFSLAQMALFAIGAYATAMLAYYGAFPLLAAMPLAALVTVAASLLIGFACLRLKGAYVALLTLAVAQVIYLIVVNDTACFTNPPSGCLPLFGGVRGFSRFGDLGFRDLLGSKFYVGHYYVGLGLLLAAQVFCILLIRGRWGLPSARCATTRVMPCRAASDGCATSCGSSASRPSSRVSPEPSMPRISVWSGPSSSRCRCCCSCWP